MTAKQQTPPLTAGEKARLAVLIARGCKASLAPGNARLVRIEADISRILDGARKRAEKTT
jgi:hypothetical protein